MASVSVVGRRGDGIDMWTTGWGGGSVIGGWVDKRGVYTGGGWGGEWMDVSVFGGSGGVLCENSMVFGEVFPGAYPHFGVWVEDTDTYNDSSKFNCISHVCCCPCGGVVWSVCWACSIGAACFDGLMGIEECSPGPEKIMNNTCHWMCAAPCFKSGTTVKK